MCNVNCINKCILVSDSKRCTVYHQYSQSSSVAVAKEVLVVRSPLNEYWTNARSVPPNEKSDVSFELKRTFVACMLCAGKLINCDFGSTHGYRTTRTPDRERIREKERAREEKKERRRGNIDQHKREQERTRENKRKQQHNHLNQPTTQQHAPPYSSAAAISAWLFERCVDVNKATGTASLGSGHKPCTGHPMGIVHVLQSIFFIALGACIKSPVPVS